VNLLKRMIITAAGVAMATGLMAGAANASTQAPFPVPNATAITFIVSNNVPGGGGPWATSQVWRTATVTFTGGVPVAPWHCAGIGWTPHYPVPPCFAFTATLRDRGSFRTDRRALTPNQFPRPGRRIRGQVSGSVTAAASYGTFYATTFPKAALVPRFWFGEVGSISTWPARFFPPGSVFGVHVSVWSVTYSAFTPCGFQRWTDNSFNFGQGPFAGNITGCFF